jgi:cysteine desulfurase
MLERRGTEVTWIGFDGGGVVDCGQLEEILAGRAEAVGLVSIMWVNNETGVIQPLERIGEICRRHGVPLHTDATQAVGRMPVDVSDLPVDLLSFSAHKFHGPKGIGGLYVRRGVRVAPRIIGGPQERSRRGGTENVPGIVGMGAAADLAAAWLATDGRHDQAALRDRFETGILAAVPEAVINGAGSPRLWTTSNIGVPRLEAEAMLLLLSERGLSASAGAACSSGSLDPSPVLLAMGVPPEIAHGSLRFSLSRETTASEITAALEIIPAVVEKLRRSFAATD